jgi:transposase-like protein
MVLIAMTCPYSHSDHITKRRKTATDKQRYRCHNPHGPHQSFLLHPASQGRLPAIKAPMIAMARHGSGRRDTVRVLGISTDTVLNELKKKRQPCSRSIRPCSTCCRLAMSQGSCGVLTQPTSTTWDPWCSATKRRGGGGRRGISAVGGCWPTGLGGARTRYWGSARPVGAVWHHTLGEGLVGHVHAASRYGGVPARQAQRAADRTETFDVTPPDEAVDASDDLLLPIHTDARHGDRVVRPSL